MLEQLAAAPEWLNRIAELLRLDADELLRRLLSVGGIWLFCYLAMRVVHLIARRIERVVDDGDDSVMSEREQRGHTVSQLLRSVSLALLISLGILLSFNVFIDIGPLLAGAGILGLAVSFGAQSLVKDVIAGFFYLLEGQFAVGDIIEVAGKSGVVERMTLRLVVLRDLHGVLHMIPNGQITMVSNKTRNWSRAVVDVGVAYGTDVDRALSVFRDEATRFTEDAEWTAQFDGPPDVLGVDDLADSAVTIRVLLRTTPGKQFAVAREFRRRIKSRLDREGIEIPFPQRTLHVVQPRPQSPGATPGPLAPRAGDGE